jgi:hypothetical protein
MFFPTDKFYKETKEILKGNQRLPDIYKDLIDWIQKNLDARIINIKYDKIENSNTPRLKLVTWSQSDYIKFQRQDQFAYNEEFQQMIASEFKRLVKIYDLGPTRLKNLFKKSKNENQGFNTDDLWICYTDFSNVAKTEAMNMIPTEQTKNFKSKYIRDYIWDIHPNIYEIIIFYYTEQQIIDHKNVNLFESIKNEYYSMIKPYDEYGFYTKDSLKIRTDSKENFDNNFESSWFYYYK